MAKEDKGTRREFLKRSTLAPVAISLAGGMRVPSAAGLSLPGNGEAEEGRQAGDQFLDFAMQQIEKTRPRLPAITSAAEAAAERIGSRNGGLLAAGDDSFTMEYVWAAGGIAFAKRWKPDKEVDTSYLHATPSTTSLPFYKSAAYEEQMYVRDVNSNDAVLLGYENEREEGAHLAAYMNQLLGDEALVLLFASESVARNIQAQYGKGENLIPITHDVPDAGIIQIPGWPEKICSGRSFVQRLNQWVFNAELIGAFLRRGKIPAILLSVTYESPQIFNLPLINSYRFIPAFEVQPVEKGALGQTYLDAMKNILSSILPGQREKFRRGAQWLAEALRNHHKAFALLIHGVDPVGLPGDPKLFSIYTEGNAQYPELKKTFSKDDVALFVGYNWYPPELAEDVDHAGGKLILCITTVQDLPPRPVMYGTEGPLIHATSLEQLPKRENHIYIDEKWSQYDAALRIPGYPFLANPSSRLAMNVVYWHFVADTVELLARQ